jgi:hypothetical protein
LACEVGVDLFEIVEDGLERGDRFGGLGGELLAPVGLLAEPGYHLAFKMGRVLAGLDFFKEIQPDFDGFTGAELGGALAFSHGRPEGGGQSVALALLQGLGAVVVALFAVALPALGFDLKAGGVLLAAAELGDGLAGVA